jgi:hypothetical protein
VVVLDLVAVAFEQVEGLEAVGADVVGSDEAAS